MDELTKMLIVQLPIVAVLAVWINSWISRLYQDFKDERKLAAEERKAMLDGQFDLKQRVGRLEEHIIGDRSPTIHRSPLSNGQTGAGS
jgi:hypothetical protein